MPIALSIASFIFNAMEKAPALIQAGIDVSDMFARTKQQATQMAQENRAPTQAEWDAQTAELNALDERIQNAHPELKTQNPGA